MATTMMDLAERLFIGTTYVYSGPYPRSDGRRSKSDLPVEQHRIREAPAGNALIGTGLDEAEISDERPNEP